MVYINRKTNGRAVTLHACKNLADACRKLHEFYLDNLTTLCTFKDELYISYKPCKMWILNKHTK